MSHHLLNLMHWLIIVASIFLLSQAIDWYRNWLDRRHPKLRMKSLQQAKAWAKAYQKLTKRRLAAGSEFLKSNAT